MKNSFSKKDLIILLLAVLLVSSMGATFWFWRQAKKAENNVRVAVPAVSSASDPTVKEARDLYIEKSGMKVGALRTPFYDRKKILSPDGVLQAEVVDMKNIHAITVLNTQTQSKRDYLIDDFSDGVVEELGDLYFSPDGKEIAVAAYVFWTARNDEILTDGMPYVYTINLETGKTTQVGSSKADDIVLRVASWAGDKPKISEQTMAEDQKPGGVPTMYLPYILK